MSLEPKACHIPTVVAGEDKTLDVKIKSCITGDPIDLSSATEITAIFLNADGTFLECKLSLSAIVLVSGQGGHFQIILSAANSALLAQSVPPKYSDIEVQFVIASKKSIVILSNAVNIVPRRYPQAP